MFREKPGAGLTVRLNILLQNILTIPDPPSVTTTAPHIMSDCGSDDSLAEAIAIYDELKLIEKRRLDDLHSRNSFLKVGILGEIRSRRTKPYTSFKKLELYFDDDPQSLKNDLRTILLGHFDHVVTGIVNLKDDEGFLRRHASFKHVLDLIQAEQRGCQTVLAMHPRKKTFNARQWLAYFVYGAASLLFIGCDAPYQHLLLSPKLQYDRAFAAFLRLLAENRHRFEAPIDPPVLEEASGIKEGHMKTESSTTQA